MIQFTLVIQNTMLFPLPQTWRCCATSPQVSHLPWTRLPPHSYTPQATPPLMYASAGGHTGVLVSLSLLLAADELTIACQFLQPPLDMSFTSQSSRPVYSAQIIVIVVSLLFCSCSARNMHGRCMKLLQHFP